MQSGIGTFKRGVANQKVNAKAFTSDSSTAALSSVLPAAQDNDDAVRPTRYGRISQETYLLTPEQIEAFHRDGCVTIEDVLTEEEMASIEVIFDRFLRREIPVPDKDFCDMSKPFGVNFEEWSIVNCMLPTKYYPEWKNNIYERLCACMAQQLFPQHEMCKDYDQLLNKRPNKQDAVFAWHQDMAYWPGLTALNPDQKDDNDSVSQSLLSTDTCTFSLAVDDSLPENGCLQYIPGSHMEKTLRTHRPLIGNNREEGHALTVDLRDTDQVRFAPAKRGSVTIHNEYVVHGSSGNQSNRSRRTYVLAFRTGEMVQAERRIGFTHSHNDQVNWDTFQDNASHRVKQGET